MFPSFLISYPCVLFEGIDLGNICVILSVSRPSDGAWSNLPAVCKVHIFSGKNISTCVFGQLHTRTIPHHIGIGPDEWFYWLVVNLVESSCPRDSGPGGQ